MVLRHARAKVVALLEKELEVTVPLEQVLYTPTGEQIHKRYLTFLGIRIPMSFPGSAGEYYNRYEVQKSLTVLGIELPVELGVTGYEILERRVVTYTPDQAQLEAELRLQEEEAAAFADCEIESREVCSQLVDHSLVLRANYRITKDIAAVREIFIKK